MIWERSHASFLSAELLFGTPVSSVLNDFELRQRSFVEDEELLVSVAVTDGESLAKMVGVLVFLEGIAWAAGAVPLGIDGSSSISMPPN